MVASTNTHDSSHADGTFGAFGERAFSDDTYLDLMISRVNDAFKYLKAVERTHRELWEQHSTTGEPLTAEQRSLIQIELYEKTLSAASGAGISDEIHEDWCYQKCAGVFLSVSSFTDFALGVEQTKLPPIEEIFLKAFLYGQNSNSHELVASMVAINPIIGAVASYTWADLNQPESFITHLATKANSPPCPVAGWYLECMNDLSDCTSQIHSIMQKLKSRIKTEPNSPAMVEEFIDLWHRDLLTVVTEAAGMATTFALSRVGPSRLSPAISYWPMYPRPQDIPSAKIDEDVSSLSFPIMQIYHDERLVESERRYNAVTLPTSLDLRELCWFTSYMKDYLTTLNGLLDKPARPHPRIGPIVRLGGAFDILCRETDDDFGGARLSITCRIPRFKDFAVRIDKERNGLALDLGSSSYQTGLRYAQEMAEISSQTVKQYPDLIDSRGALSRNNSESLAPLRSEFSEGERASIIGTILATAGKAIGTRRNPQIVSHHMRENLSIFRADNFAEVVRGIRQALLMGPHTGSQ